MMRFEAAEMWKIPTDWVNREELATRRLDGFEKRPHECGAWAAAGIFQWKAKISILKETQQIDTDVRELSGTSAVGNKQLFAIQAGAPVTVKVEFPTFLKFQDLNKVLLSAFKAMGKELGPIKMKVLYNDDPGANVLLELAAGLEKDIGKWIISAKDIKKANCYSVHLLNVSSVFNLIGCNMIGAGH